MRTDDAGRALYVFAHQDDEYAVNSRIRFDVARGLRVTCIYLTAGGVNVDPRRREEESRAVLTSYGLATTDIVFLGARLGIADGTLHHHAILALDALREFVSPFAADIHSLYTLAWEGGHHDHDATRAIVSCLVAEFGIAGRAYEYGLYDGAGMRRFFRVMRVPKSSRTFERRITFGEAWRSAVQCWRYPSQRRTWLGLFPEAFLRWLLRRREVLGTLDVERIFSRPHSGSLLYERFFHTSYEDVADGLAPLRARISEQPWT